MSRDQRPFIELAGSAILPGLAAALPATGGAGG